MANAANNALYNAKDRIKNSVNAGKAGFSKELIKGNLALKSTKKAVKAFKLPNLKAKEKALKKLKKKIEKTKKRLNKKMKGVTKKIRPIKKLFVYLRSKVKIFLKRKFIRELLKVIQCVQKGNGEVRAFAKLLNATYDKIVAMKAKKVAAFGNSFIDIFCRFKKFSKAIKALIKAFSQKDILKRYKQYGKFIGLLISNINPEILSSMKSFLKKFK